MLKGIPATKNIGKSFEERLLDKVKKLDNGCWEWQGTMDHGVRPRFPYPVSGTTISYNPRAVLADMERVKFPRGYVMGCKNKRCVNPHHVAEANKTKLQKLKSLHVQEIKKLRNDFFKHLISCGYSQGEIAVAFNTTSTVIGRQIKGINQKD